MQEHVQGEADPWRKLSVQEVQHQRPQLRQAVHILRHCHRQKMHPMCVRVQQAGGDHI